MRVLHIISSISRQGGGPSRSSQGLVSGLCAAGVDAWLMTLCRGEEPWIKGVDKFINGGTVEDALVRVKPDLVHLHGIWQYELHRCAVICRRWGIPYVIAPRGMLEPWSLKTKWLKKRIARWLYQDRDLKKAAALHATAESEADQFRRLGFTNPVIVSPNGVNVPEGMGASTGTDDEERCANRQVLAEKVIDEWIEEGAEVTFVASRKREKKTPRVVPLPEAVKTVAHHQITAGSNPPDRGEIPNNFAERKGAEDDAGNRCRRALFVSRMHPKKGVLELVEAWARVNPKGWQCELVYTLNGEEERAYEAALKARIVALGLLYAGKDADSAADFILTGPLDDKEKWSAYARADLFVLPTYSENFGIVVAEALWAGVPVMTTKGTPWRGLLERRCGWWIDLPPKESLEAALREATSLNCETLRKMGAHGRKLVEEKYTWKAVCDAMVAGYRQIV